MGHNLHLYFNNDLEQLIKKIQSEVEYYGLVGNSTNLTCSLSELGCCQLLLSNYHEAEVIMQFLCNENNFDKFSKVELAFVWRFLGLYSIFEGDIAKSISYYKQSQQNFLKIESFEAEAIMLIEAYRWLYLLCDHHEGIFYVRERLKVISKENKEIREIYYHICDKSQLYKTTALPGKFWKLIFNHTYKNMENDFSTNKPIYLSIPNLFLQLSKLYNQNNKDLINEAAFTLMAHIEQFKHPWYKAFAWMLIGSILSKDDLLKEAKILFQQLMLIENVDLCDEISVKNELLTTFFLPTITKQSFFEDQVNAKKIMYSFQLFNRFTVRHNGTEISMKNLKRKKAEEILIYLLIQPNLQVAKEVLLEELFPEVELKKASNQLYVNIHELNKKLNIQEKGTKSFISIVSKRIIIDVNQIEETDIQVYQKLFSVGSKLWMEDREAAVELYEKAITLYKTEIVPHLLYFSWIDQFRENLKTKQQLMLKKLFYHYQDDSNKERILVYCYDCDETDEFMIKEYLLLLYRQQRFEEAKVIYQQYIKRVNEEFGIEFPTDVRLFIKQGGVFSE